MKTEKELLEIARKIAKESVYIDAEATGEKWRGLNIFIPILKPSPNGEVRCVGLPQYILLNDEGEEYKENLSHEETFEIFRLFIDDEEEDFEDEEDLEEEIEL